MKAEALRELSSGELRERVQELREQSLKLRFQQSTGQIESPQMLRGVRRDVARAKTILRERELGVETPVETQATAETESAGEAAGGGG